MAGLEVTLGLDPSEFDAELKAAENKLKRLEKQKDAKVKLGLDVSDLNKQIATTKGNIDNLKDSLKGASGATQPFTKGVANGGNALMQFNRIVQDAPFGIIGMGNNITASVEAFGHLSKSSGGAGEALKAIGSSLLGTGGVIAAFSLVTTGLTYMAQNGLTVNDVFQKLTGTFDENARAMREAFIEGGKSASDEIVSLKALVKVAQDETVSRERRLIAVQKLQDEYPSYFGNLSKEAILNGNVTKQVDELTSALLAKAVAEKLTEKTAETQLKVFEANAKLNTAKAETIRLEKELAAFRSKFTKDEVYADNNKLIAENEITFAIYKSKQAEQEARNEIIKGNKILDERLKVISKIRAAGLKTEKTAGTSDVGGKDKKVFSTPQVSGLNSLLDPSGLASTFNMASTIITTGMDKAKVAFDMGGVGIMESLQNLNQGFSDIINNGLIMTLSDMGNAIGSALASGGNVLKAAGTSLLSSLGYILSQLGQMAIATGIGIKSIQTALKTLNPYVAIAAGVALVALGGAVTAKSKSLGNSMGTSSGGNNYDTGANYSSPASGSSYTSGGGSYGSGTVVFEIDGQKLVGVLSNTLGRNSKLGGSLGI